MKSTASLGWIFKIRIRSHYTWPAVFVLITAMVVTQFPEVYPLWQRVILGIAASLLFFMSVSIREFIVSFIALRRGIPVKNVTLFAFGGMSQITKEATLPILEMLMAIVGLLSILLIAGIFYWVYFVLVINGSILFAGLILWLAYIVFMLFLFHLIPAFPLDAGRLLRALLWKITSDYEQATRIASWIGRGVGLLLITGGILELIDEGRWLVGLLLALIGWILQSAAAHSHRQTTLREALQGITAQDIMVKECPLIAPELKLGQLARDCVLVTGQRYFVVADGDKIQGIVTMRNIRRIPKGRWDSTRVGEIMTPAGKLETAHHQQPTTDLLEQMDRLKINQMPVLDGDKVIGIVGRDSIIRLAKTRTELGI